jgi:hypothetical protein
MSCHSFPVQVKLPKGSLRPKIFCEVSKQWQQPEWRKLRLTVFIGREDATQQWIQD